MSSIMKGIVDEGDKSNPFQDGYDAWKAYQAGKTNYPKCPYPAGQGMGQWHEGQAAAAEEGDYDINETEAKKGADGKRCWKGKRYAGTENGKDKCIPVKNEAANPAQQAAIAISKKKKGEKPKVNEAFLAEGKLLIEARVTRKLWESAAQKIVEAQLTPQQIQQIFQAAEKGQTQAGGNRTIAGKGKDAASAVNRAWEDLKIKIQNTGPIQNMDAMYDKAAEAMKNATGGDQGAMSYVQKYRDFAKKHPMAQSFLYAALVAAAGLSGAGLGGAAALGLLKMTDRLLQGDKFSSALYKGGKTGAMAYGASQLAQHVKGADSNVPSPDEAGYNGDAIANDLSGADVIDVPSQAAPSSLPAGSPGFKDFSSMVDTDQASSLPAGAPGFKDFSSMVAPDDVDQAASAAKAAAAKAAKAKAAAGMNEGIQLSKYQVFSIMEAVILHQAALNEGILDTVKGAVGKVGQYAATKGHNLTTKITADKLMQAWKKAGSPTDSQQVKAVLKSAGVTDNVINTVMPVQAGIVGVNPQAAGTVNTTVKAPAAQQPQATAAAPAAQPTAQQPASNVNPELQKRLAARKAGKPVYAGGLEEGVIVGHDANDPEVAILGGAGTMSLSRLKKKAHQEALQLADDIANGKYNASSYNMQQLHNTLNTIVAAEKEMEKLYFGEDTDNRYAAEKTPAVNPYGGQKDRQFRGAIAEALLSEMPTDNPTGSSGAGGWRTYKPKPAGQLDEEQLDEAKIFDVVRPLVKAFNIENGAEERWASVSPLSPSASSPRRWRRGDGSYYTDPSKIIALSDKDKGLQKEFFSWLTQQPGVQPAGKVRGEFRSSDYSDAVKYKGVVFIDRGVYTEFTTPSRLRNSSVWHQKTDEDTAYAGGMGQGHSGESYRKFKPKSAGTFKEAEDYDDPNHPEFWSRRHPNHPDMKKAHDIQSYLDKEHDKKSSIMKGLSGKRK